jgi:uncharacterized membrane protein
MFAITLLGFTFNVIWAVIFLFVWVAIAFWPARVAGSKGHSFLAYFIFSLFFFPLALLVAYLSRDNSKSAPSHAVAEDEE